ncbi:type I-C CRISPR-associated endonuclease Cas1c [Thermus brockianus]|uniref:type I-C CRISPR-associated endonuclease Cas1c n=1 Tax=Thermus brockianus TaxID=56956 RepID=UPI0008FD29F8|nr:type I-C CRISPR-associated endonuclease Cas1c [Thermus brockianus]
MNRILLNSLFVQTQGAYLRLQGDTVRVEVEGELRLQVPLHHLGSLVLFGNVLVSPHLLARCSEDGRSVVWLSEHGRFQGRMVGRVSGNVLLRRAQYQALDEEEKALALAQAFVQAKVRNARVVLLRAVREGGASEVLSQALREQEAVLSALPRANSLDEVRGLEGQAAAAYFQAFGEMLLVPGFAFAGRVKRPPRDPVNALLSFLYTLLVSDAVSALEGVGLDPQVGYLHALRPGKPALALDLVEEFRAWWADRLALTLLNRRQLGPKHFLERPGGVVYLTEDGRREVLVAYQKRKQEEVIHPLLREPVPVGLLPHLQARLLARYLRGDLPRYPGFVAR